jgi:hypothetical protein
VDPIPDPLHLRKQKNIEKYSKSGNKQQQCAAQYFQIEILVLNEPCPLRFLYKGFVLYTEKCYPAFVSCSMCFFVNFSEFVPVALATYGYFTFRTFPEPMDSDYYIVVSGRL